MGPVKPLPVIVNTPDGSIGSGNIGLSSTLTAAASASGSASSTARNSAANEDFIVVIIGEWRRRCYRWRFPVRARQDGNTRRRGGCRTRSNLKRSSIVSASCWTLKGPSDGQEAFSSQETGSRQVAALREIDPDPEGGRRGSRHAGAGACAGQGAGTPRERRQARPRACVAGDGRSGAAQARKETGTGTPPAHQGYQGDARHHEEARRQRAGAQGRQRRTCAEGGGRAPSGVCRRRLLVRLPRAVLRRRHHPASREQATACRS